MSPAEARQWFGWQEPTAEQHQRLVAIRTSFAELASQVAEVVPDVAERTYALRKLKEASHAVVGGIVSPKP